MPQRTENLNVASLDLMPSPDEVKSRLPLTEAAADTVVKGRRTLEAILDGKDQRLFLVVGPCSIHDPVAGLDYARRLARLAEELSDVATIVMRVYFEKPRTSLGWKGFINDPFMDDSFRIDVGMEKARRFLLDVNELGLPAGTEALDPIAPQYYGDLVAWTAIGARTSESQTHREMSSGLSTPVGFKNGTDGDVEAAVNAIVSASRPHSLPGRQRSGAVGRRPHPRQQATGTSSCAAAADGRTSTRSPSRSPSRRSRRRRCRGTSWWTARTRTPGRSRSSSRS